MTITYQENELITYILVFWPIFTHKIKLWTQFLKKTNLCPLYEVIDLLWDQKLGKRVMQFLYVTGLWQKHEIWYTDQVSDREYKSEINISKTSNLCPLYELFDPFPQIVVPRKIDDVIQGAQIWNFWKINFRFAFSALYLSVYQISCFCHNPVTCKYCLKKFLNFWSQGRSMTSYRGHKFDFFLNWFHNIILYVILLVKIPKFKL